MRRAAFLLLVAALCVRAAYKPGWSPPACLSPRFRPTNISVEFDRDFPGPVHQSTAERIAWNDAVPVQAFFLPNETTQQMEPVFLRGMGYSPIPPSKYTYQKPFDQYTSGHSYLWERDLDLIKDMGVNVLRVWEWDSYMDHSSFLDALSDRGLYLMIPFMFSISDYTDLGKAETRLQVLTDWRAFVESVMNHPATFAFLIGNELNRDYGDQRDALFSLINLMAKVRDDVDPARHPISMPLSDQGFVSAYFNDYFAWSAVDFWSIQSYRPGKDIAEPVDHYYRSWVANGSKTGLPIKPLVFTEFGVDALQAEVKTDHWPTNGADPIPPPVDEVKQAGMFCQMFGALRDETAIEPNGVWNETQWNLTASRAMIVKGAIVMEWNDEWWKGNYPSARAPLCPNQLTAKHTYCESNIGSNGVNYFLHEEWLGLFGQIYDESGDTTCLCPRMAYDVMKMAFHCNGDPHACSGYVNYSTISSQSFDRDVFGCRTRVVPALAYNCSTRVCGHYHSFFRSSYLAMIAPALVITIVVFSVALYLRRQVKKEEAQREDMRASSNSIEVYTEPGQYVAETKETDNDGIFLKDSIAKAFHVFTDLGSVADPKECPYFLPAQDRLFRLIWDKYCGCAATNQVMLTAVTRIIYEQYMEGYQLWCSSDEPPPPQHDFMVMLKDLALYSIVQAWAGTINHCPEKNCEIFDFAKGYFEYCVKGEYGAAYRRRNVRLFHLGVVEIFRTYYLKVDEATFTFEDVNEDAIIFRGKRSAHVIESFWGKAGDRANSEGRKFQASQTADEEAPEALPRVRNDPRAPPTKAACPELDLLPSAGDYDASKQIHPYLEYHRQRNPEETLLSEASQLFFNLHKDVVGDKWMKPKQAFPQKGGPFTALFNFGWLVRYVMWQVMLAKYFQPVAIAAPLCLCDMVRYLAVLDAAWMALSGFLHWRVLDFRLALRPIAEMTFYSVCFAGIVVCWLFNIMNESNKAPAGGVANLFGLGWTIYSLYIVGAVLLLIAEEAYLMLKPSPAYTMPARFRKTSSIALVRTTFIVTLLFIGIIFGAMWLPFLANSTSPLDKMEDAIKVGVWPNLAVHIWIAMFIGFTTLGSWGIARLVASCNVDVARKTSSSRKLKEEANHLVLQYLFWGLFVVFNYMAIYYFLVPAVNNITFDTCGCQDGMPTFSEGQKRQCRQPFTITCYIAVGFTWFSTVLVCFVVLYAVFELMLLVFGVIRAKQLRVGNVKSWADVEAAFGNIHHKCLSRVSHCLLDPLNQAELWNNFVRALYDDSLLSIAERDRLLHLRKSDKIKQDRPPDFRIEPRSSEAIRRVKYYLYSLQGLQAHEQVGSTATIHTPHRRWHRVQTMPTWTCVVPAYNETVIFDESQLTSTRTPGKEHMRLTEIEYLAHTYSEEWANFAERIKEKDSTWITAPDNYANDLLNAFIRPRGSPEGNKISEDIRFEIRWWATMRGQTLARTIQGLIHWRSALVDLIKMEEPGIEEFEAQRIVSRKCQIVISHQTGNPHADVRSTTDTEKGLESRLAKEALEICFRRLKYFDVVYNDDKHFQSVCRRVRLQSVWGSPDGQDDVKYTSNLDIQVTLNNGKTKKVTRPMYNLYPESAIETLVVQRVGRLKIGEGKAENQMGALHFVNGMVLQAFDMNQYATKENGFKLPYVLTDHFNTPDARKPELLENEVVIPPYRIVGFTEHCYTRGLSLVGEFMGAAEWCFVSITQRVLNWPLRIRLHYGHPDFFDAFWVRNRGGQSKASPLVHTNEDIFAGYEMLGRGDRGTYVEFIESQKGREVTFPGAFTFEGKLAQGGAQQVRSFDVYRLNRRLDVFTRFSLFFTSLAFYLTNFLMAVSIKYYILSIALYAISGVTYHQLGLLDAVIAVPWLIQIGYVLALPLIVELTLTRGLFFAVFNFIFQLVPSILFFIFHLRTKMYYFGQGMLIGKGGYAGTGRGFGLDRPNYIEAYKSYSESHFHEALLILMVLIIYGVYGSDPPGAYLLRTFTILLIVISWFWAPLVFISAPTTRDLQADTKSMITWISGRYKPVKTVEKSAKDLELVHSARTLRLVRNLAADCIATIKMLGFGGPPAANVDAVSSPLTHVKEFKIEDSVAATTFDRLIKAEGGGGGGLEDALVGTYTILDSRRKQLETVLAQEHNLDKLPFDRTYDDEIKTFWAQAEDDSWLGWWLKCVVVNQWESEDQFFPGLVNLVAQKLMLALETYAPWIILALTQFNLESLWYMYLVVMFVVVSVIVDMGFKNHHEYSTMAKSVMILTLPFAFFYWKESVMTLSELFWSLALLGVATLIFVDFGYGALNIVAKFRAVISGNPYKVAFEAEAAKTDSVGERIGLSVRNRTKELKLTNEVEERRINLFKMRVEHLRHIQLGRKIVPALCLVVLVVGNAITVILSDWITAMNFNGRVTEAWKVAYLRPSMSTSAGPAMPPGAIAPATVPGAPQRGSRAGRSGDDDTIAGPKPLTREDQLQQDAAAGARYATQSTIQSSLNPGYASSYRASHRRHPNGRPSLPSSSGTLQNSFSEAPMASGSAGDGDMERPLLAQNSRPLLAQNSARGDRPAQQAFSVLR
jgi:hypothetical protein